MKINKIIGITFIIVTVVINLISLTLMNRMNYNSFNNYLEKEDDFIIDTISDNIEEYYYSDKQQLFEQLDEYSDVEKIFIEIKLSDNSIYMSDTINTGSNGNGIGRQRNMRNQYEELITSVEINNDNYEIIIGQHQNNRRSESITEFMNQLNNSHVISFIFSLVIAIIATIIISKLFSQPILLLNKNLKYISNGNYNKHVEITSNIHEIKQLDISSKQIAKSLNEQEEIRKQLLINLSHDLRTPLTVIKTNLEAMSDGVIELNEDNLEVASNRLDRVISILKQLDDVTTISKEVVNIEAVDISIETERIIELFTYEIKNKSIKLVKNIESNIYLNINIDHYSQIIQNLISNAIKYNKESGNLEVTLYKNRNNIYISVKDTGDGIKDEELPYIFDKFYRCDKTRGEEEGSGIGLSIVRTLVNANNGEITVESDVSSGTTFCIVFNLKGV